MPSQKSSDTVGEVVHHYAAGGSLSAFDFMRCARQQRLSYPDEQAVIGFTERALLATREPFGAP